MPQALLSFIKIVTSSSLIGTACAALLKSLQIAEDFRTTNPWIVFLLPIAGISSIAFYKKLYPQGLDGHHELHRLAKSNKRVPWVLAPLVFIGTFLSHLFGASVGREGSAVQLGGALSSSLSHRPYIRLNSDDWMRAGFAAGFSGLFATPLAGAFFALEVGRPHRSWMRAPALLHPRVFLILLASFISLQASHFAGEIWSIAHLSFPQIPTPQFSVEAVSACLVLSSVFLLAGTAYSLLKKALQAFLNSARISQKILLASCFVIAASFSTYSHFLLGLGLPMIENSFLISGGAELLIVSAGKLALTALCTAAGFIGGEVTPLFAIGSSLGNFSSSLLGDTFDFFQAFPPLAAAALGFGWVFAVAARVPLAGAFLIVETFSWTLWPWPLCSALFCLGIWQLKKSIPSIYSI